MARGANGRERHTQKRLEAGVEGGGFGHGKAEKAADLTEFMVTTVEIRQQIQAVEVDLAVGGDDFVGDLEAHDVGQEKLVGAEELGRTDLAGQGHGRLSQKGRRRERRAGHGMEAANGPLVDVAPAPNTTEIDAGSQVGGHKIDDEFAGCPNAGVRQALGPHRQGQHRGFRVDNPRPAGSHDIGARKRIAIATLRRGHEHAWQRRQQSAGTLGSFPVCAQSLLAKALAKPLPPCFFLRRCFSFLHRRFSFLHRRIWILRRRFGFLHRRLGFLRQRFGFLNRSTIWMQARSTTWFLTLSTLSTLSAAGFMT